MIRTRSQKSLSTALTTRPDPRSFGEREKEMIVIIDGLRSEVGCPIATRARETEKCM